MGSRSLERLNEVIDAVVDRRAAGEHLSDSVVMAEHPELMPELGVRLRELKMVEDAVRQADAAASSSALTASHSDSDAIANGIAESETAPTAMLPATDAFAGYEITRELSRGGQGVVYEALQRTTKRKVAIKVLLGGAYASAASRRRFEREIELVAALKHPGIISIFHSGHTADGRMFYVMDYCAGLPLQRHIRERRLGMDAALRLFERVCEAVQYAHQRGVIHRDLKPSNILVDADGGPRVLDFGLAKMESAADQTVVSIGEQVIGTLPYMSPEQARGQLEEIDTRSDVYSLGIILYEILTGQFPYPVIGRIDDVLRHITETEPTPPRRSWTAESGLPVGSSARRRRDRRQCPIDDELQTIVLKALAKERERRYSSVAELGEDISHYLAGEAISAKRESVVYLLGKAMRKHRLALSIASAFAVILAVFAVGSTILWRRAVAAEAMEHRELLVAQTARGKAEQQRRVAEQRQKEANEAARVQARILADVNISAMGHRWRVHLREAVQERMKRRLHDDGADELKTFDRVVSGPMAVDAARKIIDEFLLAPASRMVQNELSNPLVQAQVRLAIGTTYLHLGLYTLAEPHLLFAMETRERILGKEHLDVAAAMYQLGWCLWEHPDSSGAGELFEQALAMRRRQLPPNHADVAMSLDTLGRYYTIKLNAYDRAEPLIREALEIRRKLYGDESAPLVDSYLHLAELLRRRDDNQEAESLYRKALKIQRGGTNRLELATVLNNLGTLLLANGDGENAEPLLREAMQIRRELLGHEHRSTAATTHSLASLLAERRDFTHAEPLIREAVEVSFRALAPRDPELARMRIVLGRCLMSRQRWDEAEREFQAAYDDLRDNPDAPFALRKSVQALIELYDARQAAEPGKDFATKAATWRKMLKAAAASSQPAVPASNRVEVRARPGS